jgi:hypothetical protein
VTGAASASQAAAEERKLADALRRGDEDAFRDLVLTHDGGLRRMARLYVGEAVAEDVVQETWIVVVRGIGGFESRSALRTWIFGILVNIARRYAAREGRTIPFASVAGASERYQVRSTRIGSSTPSSGAATGRRRRAGRGILSRVHSRPRRGRWCPVRSARSRLHSAR